MIASDYQINFPYGATSAPYGTAAYPYHRGNDRPCPDGTPVVINGITIGLTGHTGLVTGPHLHIQEWSSSYTQDRKPRNEFSGGTVSDTGTLSEFGNFVTIQTADGWHDTYCHLSKINVTKGQVIGGDMITKEQEDSLSIMQTGSIPGVNYDYRFTGLPLTQLNLDKMLQFWSAQPRPASPEFEEVPKLYIKK